MLRSAAGSFFRKLKFLHKPRLLFSMPGDALVSKRDYNHLPFCFRIGQSLGKRAGFVGAGKPML
jgi:hypothetical protein